MSCSLIKENYLQSILQNDNQSVYVDPDCFVIVTLSDNSTLQIKGSALRSKFTTVNSAFVIDIPININPQQIQNCYIPWMSLFISETTPYLTFIPLRPTAAALSPIKYEFINFNLINSNTNFRTPQRNFTIIIGESSDPDPDPPIYDTDDFLTTTQINEVLGAGELVQNSRKNLN